MIRTILFVGGGTAGHIAPVLSVIEAVITEAKRRGIELKCIYAGQQTDLDSPLVKESKLSFETRVVHSGKLHRHLTWDQIRQAKNFLQGMGEARRLVAELKPDVVFAKGGYSTVPLVWAAT
jgi:UDP-N-acetylglucosamine--N-acetylmuramyl-(pentapeptide) pyrophosphoryl-undecaprenol N-acetylglucosamine transferase